MSVYLAASGGCSMLTGMCQVHISSFVKWRCSNAFGALHPGLHLSLLQKHASVTAAVSVWLGEEKSFESPVQLNDLCD